MNKQKIIPSLWFNHNASAAFESYVQIFHNSQIIKNNPVVVEASLSDVLFIGINGGDQFKPNASISFMYTFEDKSYLETVWEKFVSAGAKIIIPIGNYPWSTLYGWIEDYNGVNWQFYYGKLVDVNDQQICPTLMFGHTQQGKCTEAINFYKSVFSDFELQGILHYANNEALKDQVQHAQFRVLGYTMMAMDSEVAQSSSFNEGVSLTISCSNQEEIDYYWNAFTKDGKESSCGWCIDPYGVHWQIVPNNLDELMQHEHAMQNLLKMKKIIIDDLKK